MTHSSASKSIGIIWVVMLATLVVSFFGKYAFSPAIIKLMYSAALGFTLIMFPYGNFKSKEFSTFTKILLGGLMALTLIAVLRSAILPPDSAIGNKWLTLFGNEDCMFMLLTPAFILLAADDESVPCLESAMEVFLLISVAGILVGNQWASKVLWFTPVFFPYSNLRTKLLIIASVLISVFIAFFIEDSVRTAAVLALFACASFIIAYVLKSKAAATVLFAFMLVMPLFIVIPALFFPENSLFQRVMEYFLLNSGDTTLAEDSRSFLYLEMAEDLSQNHAWILGKGAYSHYFSDYFLQSTTGEGDHYDRLASEVTMLTFLLRSGICYVALYYSLIITAIVSALKKSRNRFLIAVSVMASGWMFVSFISYLNGCSFQHLGFFLIMGCCLSSKWQNYTDDELKTALKFPDHEIS